jgi:WD40 repeat protein
VNRKKKIRKQICGGWTSNYAAIAFNVSYNIQKEFFLKYTLIFFDLNKNIPIHILSNNSSCSAEAQRSGIPLSNLNFNSTIEGVEAHPYFENIFLTVDYDGMIVIWNATLGTIINVFKENGIHLK